MAASDPIKKNKVVCDAMNTTQVISKLLKYSPRRDVQFEKIKEELAPAILGFRTLCPMRWTVRACSLQSVTDNYAVFQELWDEALDIVHDFDSRAQIGGVKASMKPSTTSLVWSCDSAYCGTQIISARHYKVQR